MEKLITWGKLFLIAAMWLVLVFGAVAVAFLLGATTLALVGDFFIGKVLTVVVAVFVMVVGHEVRASFMNRFASSLLKE